jgi:hypothetical protein
MQNTMIATMSGIANWFQAPGLRAASVVILWILSILEKYTAYRPPIRMLFWPNRSRISSGAMRLVWWGR